MTKNVQVSGARIVEAACRIDFLSFFRRCFYTLMPGRAYEQDWHIEAMAYQLEQVRCGKTKRLAINISPRSLKSKIGSVAFPAFILGHDPTKQIICISYGLDLASTLSNEFRTIVNSSWYQQLFPAMRISKNSEFEVVTTRGGYRLATSIDGSLTGRGADFIIIDDPLKSIDAHSSMREHVNNWYRESVRQRLNDMRTGAIIVVMQRLHVDDLTGMLLRLPEEWTLLSLAAIAKHDEKYKLATTIITCADLAKYFNPSEKQKKPWNYFVPASVLRRSKRIISKRPFHWRAP